MLIEKYSISLSGGFYFDSNTSQSSSGENGSFSPEPGQQLSGGTTEESGLGAMGIKLYYTTVTASRTVSPADFCVSVAD